MLASFFCFSPNLLLPALFELTVRQVQTFQRQILVDMLDFGDQRGHELGQSTVGDNFDTAPINHSGNFAPETMQ